METGNEGSKIKTEESKCNSKTVNRSRVKKRLANRPHHRLHSIRYDTVMFLQESIGDLRACESTRKFPIVSNERCGTWYAYPIAEKGERFETVEDTSNSNDGNSKLHSCSCYFKSTDGHYGTWNFSLKRLNLGVVRLVSRHGGCIILDASGSKRLPDSMSRTIPIWACVLNRIVARYRREFGNDENGSTLDNTLYTPSCIVSAEEHNTIESLIDDRVDMLYKCKAIVDPKWLVKTLSKPLRPIWRAPGWTEGFEDQKDAEGYFVLVCINSSSIDLAGEILPCINRKDSFIYSPGAADDHSLWSRGLTPPLFWQHERSIMGASTCEDETDRIIDVIVNTGSQQLEQEEDKQGATRTSLVSHESFHFIGNLGVAVGSRRSGRPPECWKHFDAILNVTDMEYEYDDMMVATGAVKRYLQLPVREGKKDRTELERWLSVGIIFILNHVSKAQRVLVHCAQGRDRSVAILMATVALGCDLELPLSWSKERIKNLPALIESMQRSSGGKAVEFYRRSGLSVDTVEALMGSSGRTMLMNWFREEIGMQDDAGFLASKETLRLALLLIQQDREVADPSRSTMQKLNRFFMSNVNFG